MMKPTFPFARVQSIESLRYQLGMSPDELISLSKRVNRLYFVATKIPKEDGTVRVTYDTRPPLKRVLHRINSCFLRPVIYPSYLTGGVPKKDYVHSVQIHAKAKTVLKSDITKFYPSVSADLVYEIWRSFFRFGHDVSLLLTALTTRNGHLEQGAPTSSYLANLALWDVEDVFKKALRRHGFTRYSRHIDDIVMSSDDNLSGKSIDFAVEKLEETLHQKGLSINPKKTIVMVGHAPIKILNLVGNAKPSLPKKERSRVRALVHQFCQSANQDGSFAPSEKHKNQVRGQAHKVRRLHKREGENLVSQLQSAFEILDKRVKNLPEEIKDQCQSIS